MGKAVCGYLKFGAQAALVVFVLLWVAAVPRLACAQSDYDTQSEAWNGLQSLIRVAQEGEVELRPSAVLDWAAIGRNDGLLVLYPLSSIDRTDLTSFLE